ncbi:MAG: gliding motility-associated C-terminal domain-containing protein, partial [Saprospiraceae bacterium]|nr:gliding motility-associated C-terminal domain-containing protein [Saprospiraceae bacterium]MCC7504683.1 gliding motility-associated C-terminal domain-containing protein [Saprospiraceae bacterium]
RESEIDQPDIYIPDVFRPGSADNGIFTVFADQQILNIRIMQVYDRWGELVADYRDLAPNGPAGWTGDYRGSACSPGVYGYYIELDMADGSVKRLKGGVTLVR